jgi:hypothetical protein
MQPITEAEKKRFECCHPLWNSFWKKIQLDWRPWIVVIDQLYTYSCANCITSDTYAAYYGGRKKKIRIWSCVVRMVKIFFFKKNTVALATRERKRTEPIRTEPIRSELEPKFWKMSRTEPNPNRLFESSFEPNRTELEPDDLGSICVYGSSEFWKVILYTRSSALVSSKRVISW